MPEVHNIQDAFLQAALHSADPQNHPDLARLQNRASYTERKTSWGYMYLLDVLKELNMLSGTDFRLTDERFEDQYQGWSAVHGPHVAESAKALETAYQHTQNSLNVFGPSSTLRLSCVLRPLQAWRVMYGILQARKTQQQHLHFRMDRLLSFSQAPTASPPCILWTRQVPREDILLWGYVTTPMDLSEFVVLNRHPEGHLSIPLSELEVRGGFRPTDVLQNQEGWQESTPSVLPLPTIQEQEANEASIASARQLERQFPDPLLRRLTRSIINLRKIR
ncbi:hypothetical protein [Deinococcus roseus]|uniref:Uncharacterized protein n=1 Tax=Deinococcus roseus TaxID=392414 RepID=A0ABQ2D178_9DEIO|nr:hypothetical protein [Deinococcus roseus]GGJ40831.1 hypothetical protein GCM10008938_28590 [Deinococcus roseus]